MEDQKILPSLFGRIQTSISRLRIACRQLNFQNQISPLPFCGLIISIALIRPKIHKLLLVILPENFVRSFLTSND